MVKIDPFKELANITLVDNPPPDLAFEAYLAARYSDPVVVALMRLNHSVRELVDYYARP